MAARYYNTFWSLAGDVYQIYIMDSSFTGATTFFKSDDSGFKLSYKGLSERLDSILSSDCSCDFIVENSVHATFILEMISANEERFGVNVYKNGALYWVGVLIGDGIELEDKYYPYNVTLKFQDGLGRLSDKFYNSAGLEIMSSPYSGRQSFLGHILNCLYWAGTMQYYTATDTFLKAQINWYSAYHVLTNNFCSLVASDVNHSVFYEYDDQGVITYKTAGDVLRMVLGVWNARIFQAGGIYHIVQASEYQYTVMKSWTFQKDGTQKAYYLNDATNYKLNSALLVRGSGGVTKYLPPLLEVKKIYKYKYANTDNGNLLPVQSQYTTTVQFLNSVFWAAGANLRFSGNLHEVVSVSNTTFALYAEFRMKVILTGATTTYYLSGTSANPVWSNNSSAFVEIIPLYPDQGHYLGTNENSMALLAFNTANIPCDGTVTFSLVLHHYRDFAGNVRTLPPGDTWVYACEQFCFVEESLVTDLAGDKIFLTINGVNTKATQRIVMKDTQIGDGPYDYSLGRIMIFRGSVWVVSARWARNAPPGVYGAGDDINQLSVKENLSGQSKPTEIFQGDFIGSAFCVEKAIVWGAKVLVPLQIDISPAQDSVSGRWFNAVIPAF